MRLYDKIAGHLALLQEMKKAGVSDALLKDYKEEELLGLSQSVNQMDAKEEILSMETEAVEYLIHDQEFLSYLVRLLREDICDPVRISILLADAGGDALSKNYSYEEIVSVLADEQVKSYRAYIYLKYFAAQLLHEAEKEYLMDGLAALDQCGSFSVDDLTDTERKHLIEPAVSSIFLQERIKDRRFWRKLENPSYCALLNDLSFLCEGVSLGADQAEELWQHTAEIQEGLDAVLRKLPGYEMGKFLALWLDNKALVYDLNRLKYILPELPHETAKGATMQEKVSELPHETMQGASEMQSDLDEHSDRRVKFTENQLTYLNFLYGDLLNGVDLSYLSERQMKLLVYAVTHKKKHFLTIVKEHFEDFTVLQRFALLLDTDTYEHYLNVNTLNPQNLKDSRHLPKISDECKCYLNKEPYTFDELKLLAKADSRYVRLYHMLAYPKVDDRLRVIREVAGRKCLPQKMEEEQYAKLGRMLSKKPISKWLSEDMGHIRRISYQQAVLLLLVWDQVQRLIPDVRTGIQVDFLLKNLKKIENIPDFQTVADQILEIDSTWKKLNDLLKIGEDFLRENQEGLKNFLYEGGSEIFYAFLSDVEEADKEKARRLCAAEIAGRFLDVKYYKNDLKREITLELPEEIQQFWRKNTEAKKGKVRLWEEDRLLPVMQIGESLGKTCISYRNGLYKACLLSCFDANKKVLYGSYNGQFAFRAIIRLTKGAFSKMPVEKQRLQFADILEEEMTECREGNQQEYLTLFLERPYFKGISEEKEKEVVLAAVEMLLRKAKQLHAELVVSNSYKRFGLEEKKFIRAKYYMYISASKNGKQYLDSLGGMAEVSSEGSYGEGYFFLRESFLNPKTDKQ